jgi:hypothetical protein
MPRRYDRPRGRSRVADGCTGETLACLIRPMQRAGSVAAWQRRWSRTAHLGAAVHSARRKPARDQHQPAHLGGSSERCEAPTSTTLCDNGFGHGRPTPPRLPLLHIRSIHLGGRPRRHRPALPRRRTGGEPRRRRQQYRFSRIVSAKERWVDRPGRARRPHPRGPPMRRHSRVRLGRSSLAHGRQSY